MGRAKNSDRPRNQRITETPLLIMDESFLDDDAEKRYDAELETEETVAAKGYLPDDLTKECSRLMHYAAYRLNNTEEPNAIDYWKQRYFHWRDKIILGNQKLIFRAVTKFPYLSNYSDDLMGECYIIMIRAVAAFNPWFGIRFSTYTVTCLMRALARQSRRLVSVNQMMQPYSDEMNDTLGEQVAELDDAVAAQWNRIEPYLQVDHDLLDSREKLVLKRRFSLDGDEDYTSLEAVGKQIGISKERVRQIQLRALAKIKVSVLEVS